MSERKYSVKEIDDLRAMCQMRWLFGSTNPGNSAMSRQYSGGEMDRAVEELVRTHMLAGHTGQDLRDADEPKAAVRKLK